ncbi:MAG: hypothetical protein FJW20_10775 [Acidimicrobiia bacterium]|nr:hypothetical protein [Acidimicrobiia bacterium]
MRTSTRIGFLASALAAAVWAQPLAGTEELRRTGDLAAQMVESIDAYLMRRLSEAPSRRVAPKPGDRGTLRRLLGLVDAPAAEVSLQFGAKVGQGHGFEILHVRWPALEGVEGEGLLLRPAKPKAFAVALPDADWTPEMLAGLAPGLPPEQQFARRLAESGCLVLVPALLDRSDEFSGKQGVRFTNQPHREFVYRMAYEMGRHIIGYELQKVFAAIGAGGKLPVGIFGYGEGGLLALHAAALDERIKTAVVSGYFGPREQVWSQPIYRNVWSQLLQFGDAELAALAAPREVIIEASPHPQVAGPPLERDGRRGAASGGISTPPVEAVRAEFQRAAGYRAGLKFIEGGPSSDETLAAFLGSLGLKPAPLGKVTSLQSAYEPKPRTKRLMDQMIEHTQRLVRRSEFERRKFPEALTKAGLKKMGEIAGPARDRFWGEVIGRMPEPEGSFVAQSRKLYDEPGFTGHEVLLPVWGDVFAYGILLIPRDMKPGERRAAVVAQHGLEGRPQHLIAPADERMDRVYGRLAAVLAQRGYVVFAPQNPYIGEEKFRALVRKSHPLKLTLFSFIAGQHARILEWLASLPFVDGGRIGFYGLSYGGKTAMRVPALLPRYALSICSADFNEWVWKVTSVDEPFSYMYTREYDMLEFDLGHTFNYAEMAALIAPRPFMVERGHRDGVGIDEWVAYEYAKVRRLYAFLGIPERTTIEFFNGPHQIHGQGTLEFLERHLKPR